MTENAIIESTTLGYEDHGILTAWLFLNGTGWGQGFGGYAFDSYDQTAKKRIGVAFGMRFIAEVLATVGVDTWENLKGQHVRIEREAGRISRIGNILENKWFDPKNLVESMKSEKVIP